MAAVYVSSVAAAAWASGSPVSTTITVSSVTDGVLFAYVGWGGTGDVSGVSSADGSFTVVPNSHISSATDRTVGSAWYYIVNPTSGSTNVGATFSGSIDVAHIAVLQFSGAHQTTPYGDVSTVVQATSPFVFAVSSAAGDIMLSGAVNSAPGALNLTDITDGTLRWEVNETGFWGTTSIGGTKDSEAVSTQMTYTLRTDNGGPVSGFTVLGSGEKTAAVTGTVSSGATETDIVSGGKTLIVTVSGDTYKVSTLVQPIPVDADTLFSGSNTASTLWWVSTQATSTGDLMIVHLTWDDSTTVSSITASTTPDGGAWTSMLGPIASNNTQNRSQVWYAICTTSWTATSVRFTPSASEQRIAGVMRVLAGEFDSTTPIGAVSSYNANTSTALIANCPSFTTGASDATGTYVCFFGVDTNNVTSYASSWTAVSSQDIGAVAGAIAYRNGAVGNSETVSSVTFGHAAGASANIGYILRPWQTSAFDTARQDFINGVDSAQSEGTGWDAVVKAGQHVSTVVRTSDTVVTMTLSPYASYNITAQETVTVSVPGSILTGGTPILATSTFNIATVGGGGGTFFMVDKMLLLGVS